jgi:hypothetical protein
MVRAIESHYAQGLLSFQARRECGVNDFHFDSQMLSAVLAGLGLARH